MSFRIRDVENMRRGVMVCDWSSSAQHLVTWQTQLWSHQRYPLAFFPLSLFHMLWYQTRSLSAEKFLFWRKWRVGISHCGEQQFLLFLVMVAPTSWLSQHLTLQGCVWQAWAWLCGTKSRIHVLTGFLCFVQMDRRPVTASIVLGCPAGKNPWHTVTALTAAFPSALGAVVHYKM